MSHLKEPVVINFTATSLGANDYVLVYPTPYRFTFNENFYGSYGWIPSGNYPNADVAYYVRNETANTDIGRIDIYSSNGAFIFNTVDSSPVFVPVGNIITIKAPATASIGRFGISLVGER